MVFGRGGQAGVPLVAHRDVPLISFTGSTVTGQRIRAAAMLHTKKLSLEVRRPGGGTGQGWSPDKKRTFLFVV